MRGLGGFGAFWVQVFVFRVLDVFTGLWIHISVCLGISNSGC